MSFQSILARQELTASEALLANIEAAKTRLFEAQFVIAFLRDDVYMQEVSSAFQKYRSVEFVWMCLVIVQLERMVREFRQPLSEQLSPLNASRRHADSKSDSLPPIEKGAASSSGKTDD